jgi:hypothetical protein
MTPNASEYRKAITPVNTKNEALEAMLLDWLVIFVRSSGVGVGHVALFST